MSRPDRLPGTLLFDLDVFGEAVRHLPGPPSILRYLSVSSTTNSTHSSSSQADDRVITMQSQNTLNMLSATESLAVEAKCDNERIWQSEHPSLRSPSAQAVTFGATPFPYLLLQRVGRYFQVGLLQS